MAQQEITLQSGVSGYESLTPVAHTGLVDTTRAIKRIFDQNTMNNVQPSVGDTTVNVNIDHVDDYNDLVRKMIHDKNFERFIQSMTIDRIVGGSAQKKYGYDIHYRK